MKTIQRIAGVFLILGLVFWGIFLVRTEGDFSRISNETVVLKEKTFKASQVNQLNFDMTSTDVVITGSDQLDQILIQYPESKKRSYTVEQENGQLLITEKTKPVFGLLNLDFDFLISENRTVQATLPKDVLTTLKIDASSGDVSIQDLVIKEEMQMELSSGSVKIENTQITGKLSIGLTSGDITLAEIKTEDLNLRTTSGDIHIHQAEVAKLAKVEVTSGDILFDGFSAGQETDLSATSGNIQGRLAGSITDYSIQSKSTFGANTLPQKLEGGKKNLLVEVTSGDIDIQFNN